MKFSIEINVEDEKSGKSIVLAPAEKSEELCVGKVVDFQLTSGEKAQYMVQRMDEDGYLCLLVDCLPKAYRMNRENTNTGGYCASELRDHMTSDILALFPAELRDRMIPFANGFILAKLMPYSSK